MLTHRMIAHSFPSWASALARFYAIGASHTSESVETNNDLPGLRNIVLQYVVPKTLSDTVPMVVPYLTSCGVWQMPVNRFADIPVIPQPNAMTCTLSCAWMKMMDLCGDAFFLQHPQLSLLKNEMVSVHFQLLANTVPKNKRVYRVLQTRFQSAGDLQRLLHVYGAGAIGLQLGDRDIDHWVIVDSIKRVVKTEKKAAYSHHLLSIRDPASGMAGTLRVKFTRKSAYLLDIHKQPSTAILIKDFTTFYKDDLKGDVHPFDTPSR